MSPTFEALLADARRRLAAAPFAPPAREAYLLLGHVLGLAEAQVMARRGEEVPREAAGRFERLLARRLEGEPLAYLTGERELWGRRFLVDSRVLVPRPETEHLVEAALEISLPPRPRVLDVGTGSGCIAVTLALEIAGAFAVGTDVSAGALAVARANARRHGARGKLALVRTDLAAGLDLEAFHLVAANLPYVDPSTAESLSVEVTRFEPAEALFADGAGTAAIERLLVRGQGLRPGVPVLLEIGIGQEAAVGGLAREHGFALRRVIPDLAGIPRTVELRRL